MHLQHMTVEKSLSETTMNEFHHKMNQAWKQYYYSIILSMQTVTAVQCVNQKMWSLYS